LDENGRTVGQRRRARQIRPVRIYNEPTDRTSIKRIKYISAANGRRRRFRNVVSVCCFVAPAAPPDVIPYENVRDRRTLDVARFRPGRSSYRAEKLRVRFSPSPQRRIAFLHHEPTVIITRWRYRNGRSTFTRNRVRNNRWTTERFYRIGHFSNYPDERRHFYAPVTEIGWEGGSVRIRRVF